MIFQPLKYLSSGGGFKKGNIRPAAKEFCELENMFRTIYEPRSWFIDSGSMKTVFLKGLRHVVRRTLHLLVPSLPMEWDELVRVASLHESKHLGTVENSDVSEKLESLTCRMDILQFQQARSVDS